MIDNPYEGGVEEEDWERIEELGGHSSLVERDSSEDQGDERNADSTKEANMRTIIGLVIGLILGAGGAVVGQISDERYTDTGLTPQESTYFESIEREQQWREGLRMDPFREDPC